MKILHTLDQSAREIMHSTQQHDMHMTQAVK